MAFGPSGPTDTPTATPPLTCPSSDGVILYRDAGFACAHQGDGSGYVQRFGTGAQDVPGSFNDQASSLRIRAGWSVKLYEHAGGGGGSACRTASDDNFWGDRFSSGTALDDNISSFEVFNQPTCGANQPPGTPASIGPGDYFVSADGLAPTVCWNNPGDPDADQIGFYAEVFDSAVNDNSGWITGTCWRPGQLDRQYHTFQWRVKARDGQSESGWSTVRHFTIDPPDRPPEIAFNSANGADFPSGVVFSNNPDWTFAGTASDPEGQLDHVAWRCSGDGCGAAAGQSGTSSWSVQRSGMSGRNDIFFVAYDDAAHNTASRHLDLRIDLAAPTSRACANGECDPGRWPGWFTGPVQLRLEAPDGATGHAASGTQRLFYRVDGGAWAAQGGDVASLALSGDGQHAVDFYGLDNAGNQEAMRSTAIRIDATLPGGIGGVNETHGVAGNLWQAAQQVPTYQWAASADATSGIASYQLYFGPDPNGAAVLRQVAAGASRTWTPLPGGVRTGVYYLRGRTCDVAVNCSPWVALHTFRYDGTPPENPGQAAHAAGAPQDTWQRSIGAADFTWPVPQDEGSGLHGYYVNWTTSPTATTGALQTVNHLQSPALCAADSACTAYLRVRSVDGVGNLAPAWSTLFVLRYDNAPPGVDFAFHGGITHTAQTLVTLDITATDQGSGGRMMRFSDDGAHWTPWERAAAQRQWSIPQFGGQDWPVYVQVQDGVGLVSPAALHAIHIDPNPQPARVTLAAVGDCNADNRRDGGDLSALVLDLFGQLSGDPHGCDANANGTVEAGDLSCLVLMIFNGPLACSPPPPARDCAAPPVMLNSNSSFTSDAVATASVCDPQATTMMVSRNSDFSGAAWEPYRNDWPIDLTSPDAPVNPRYVYVAFRDPDGTQRTAYSDGIIYDSVAPTGSISASLTASGVQLSLNALDDNSGISKMQISEQADFAGAAWQPYAAVRPYTPSAGDGMKTLFARFLDVAGNISSVSQTSFTYDTTPPTGSIRFDPPVVGPATVMVTLALSADDNLSGVTGMRVGTDPALAGAAWAPFAPTLTMPISPTAQSPVRYYAQFRDLAGNMSAIYTDAYLRDTQAPVAYAEAPPGDDLARTLTIHAYDALSAITTMQLSNDPLMIDGVVTLPYTDTVAWVFDDRLVVWVVLEDAVGNRSAPLPCMPTLTPSPVPPTGSTAPVSGVQLFEDEVVPGVLDRMTEAHVNFVRIPLSWRYIEPVNTDPPTYGWSGLDPILSTLTSQGLIPVPVVFQNAYWASSNGCGAVDLVPVSRFQAFIQAMAERYDADGVNDAPGSPLVNHWEIGNEMDFDPAHAAGAHDHGSCFGGGPGPAADYGRYLRAAYLGARAANPAETIILGGVAYDRLFNRPGHTPPDGAPFDYFFERNVMDYLFTNHRTEPEYPFFDWTAIHVYNDFRNEWDGDPPYNQEFRGKVNDFRANQLVSDGNYDWRARPVAVTEVGQPSAPADQYTDRNENLQAAYAGQLMARVKAEGVPYLSWFTGQDRFFGSCYYIYDWLQYGLLRSQTVYDQALACGSANPIPEYVVSGPYETKPAHTAFKTANEQIGQAIFANQLTPAQTGYTQIEAYRYYHPGQGYVIVAFTDTGERLGRRNYAPLTLTMNFRESLFPGWTGRLAITDYLGNTTYAIGNSIAVTIGQEPVYVRPD